MKASNATFIVFALLLLCPALIATSVNATMNLQIMLLTTKPSYWLGEAVPTYGYLLANGSTAHDGIVCLEIDTPQSNFSSSHPFLFRTLPTGTFSHGPQPLVITSVFSSDQNGVPKNLTRGTTGYFNLNVTNNNSTQVNFLLVVTVFDPLRGAVDSSLFSTTILGNDVATIRLPLSIPSQAPMGTAIAFANIFDKLPKQGGTPLAWEKNCTFTIKDPNLPSNATGVPPNLGAPYNGQFLTNFTIPKYQTLGNFTIYTSSKYARTTTTAQKTILVKVPDLNGDGKVNVLDLISVSTKLGWTGHPGDIPQDLNIDGRVNVLDLIIVAQWLGWVHP